MAAAITVASLCNIVIGHVHFQISTNAQRTMAVAITRAQTRWAHTNVRVATATRDGTNLTIASVRYCLPGKLG